MSMAIAMLPSCFLTIDLQDYPYQASTDMSPQDLVDSPADLVQDTSKDTPGDILDDETQDLPTDEGMEDTPRDIGPDKTDMDMSREDIPIQKKTIFFTEIMSDTTSTIHKNMTAEWSEYFEIYNPNTYAVPIKDMRLVVEKTDGAGITRTLEPINSTLSIPPQSHFVFVRRIQDGVDGFSNVLQTDLYYEYAMDEPQYALGNSPRRLVLSLRNSMNQYEEQDSLTWNKNALLSPDAMISNTLDIVQDRALSLSATAYDHIANDDPANWCIEETSFVGAQVSLYGSPHQAHQGMCNQTPP